MHDNSLSKTATAISPAANSTTARNTISASVSTRQQKPQNSRILRLGTRSSKLALTQSEGIANRLRDLGYNVEIHTIRTSGDTSNTSLSQSGLGVFAAALRKALLTGEVDFAVHSFKDLPVAQPEGLTIAAVPTRVDIRDRLCSNFGGLAQLAPGSRVGTGSPRRASQLLAARPDLEIIDIRGNVPTRLARINKDLAAVVLAEAGLQRLGLDPAGEILPAELLLPAPAQGALAVECRSEDWELREILAQLDDPPSHWCAVAERQILAKLNAGCAAPIAALAVFNGGKIRLQARYQSATKLIEANANALVTDLESAISLGNLVAEKLLAQGLELSELEKAPLIMRKLELPLSGLELLLPDSVSDSMVEDLRDAGANLSFGKFTEITVLPSDLASVLGSAENFDWVIITSTATLSALANLGFPITAWLAPQTKVAAVGPITAAKLTELGITVTLVPEAGNGKALAQELVTYHELRPGTQIFLPGSALMNQELAEILTASGAQVSRASVYTNEACQEIASELRQRYQNREFDAVLGTAGSVIRAIAKLLGPDSQTPLLTLGPKSQKTAQELGFSEIWLADTPSSAAVITALSRIKAQKTKKLETS